MLASELFESSSICPVCGCTPCNCTHVVNEGWKDVVGATALGAAALAGIAGSAKYHPVTTIQGKEFIQQELPGNMSQVKVVKDDNGQEVYAWVEKSGMRPQYTYYWYAPKDQVKEGTFVPKGGAGQKTKWLVTLKNGKKKTVNAATKSGVKDFLTSDELIIGVKSVVKQQGVAEGVVVPFPKKEKPKAKPVHCPKCGNEMQSGKMDGERVKVCVPCLTYIKDKSVEEGKWHVSPSGVKTNMSPTDDDYDINYGKGGGVAKFRKSQGLDVKTGAKKDVEEDSDQCWKGYKQIGMKDKSGKKVPNCVPEGTDIVPASNPEDSVTLDIPLLIRLLEYAREDAKTDMDLHNVAERLITLSAGGKTLSMANYDTIIPGAAD